jgi:hypothetical protein
MANLISNYISVNNGNAEVLAYWENYVYTISQFKDNFDGLGQFLWPNVARAEINLTELTGTKWFNLADVPPTFENRFLHIQSAWSPCTRYIADLWRQLRAIDPDVGVQTVWQDQDTDDQGIFALHAVENVLRFHIPMANFIPYVNCRPCYGMWPSVFLGPAVFRTENRWREICDTIAQIVESTQSDEGTFTLSCTNPMTGEVISVPLLDTKAAQAAETTTSAVAQAETGAVRPLAEVLADLMVYFPWMDKAIGPGHPN